MKPQVLAYIEVRQNARRCRKESCHSEIEVYSLDAALYREAGDPQRFSYVAEAPLAAELAELDEQMTKLGRDYNGDKELLSPHAPVGPGAHDDANPNSSRPRDRDVEWGRPFRIVRIGGIQMGTFDGERCLFSGGGQYNTSDFVGGIGMSGMSKQEMKHLVNRYIGVSKDGYLGDFSYRTHENFYPEFCNLAYDPRAYEGSTRSRFEAILESAPPSDQAAIIRGILAKYPPSPEHSLRTQEAHDAFLKVAIRLESSGAVDGPPTVITSAIVEHAIADAEALIKTRGATSGVDRVHTMLHGYLRAVCDDAGITYTKEATIGALFKAIRETHPAFVSAGPRPQDITQIVRAFGAVLDVLNPIRNNSSAAHANNDLLPEPEAMLVINATKTILHFVDAKLAGGKAT